MDAGGPTEWEGQPPELVPIGTIDPDDETINLLMDDSDEEYDEEIITDDDEVVEELFSATPDLSDVSEEDSADNGSPETRSGDDRDETEPSENAWEERAEVTEEELSDVVSVEGTNDPDQTRSDSVERAALHDAIQASLDLEAIEATVDERPLTPDSIQTIQTPPSTPDNGVRRDGLGPLGATQKVDSMTGTRSPICAVDGVDPEPDPEVMDPHYRPALETARVLSSQLAGMTREERKETLSIIRYLIALENPRCKPVDYEHVPFGDGEAERTRPTECVRPAEEATEGRRSSENRENPDGAKMAAPRESNVGLNMADHDEMPTTDSKPKRFQRPGNRREEQARSSRSGGHGTKCGSCDSSRHGFSDSPFLRETPGADQEQRTGTERATGARPKTGQYKGAHAQKPRAESVDESGRPTGQELHPSSDARAAKRDKLYENREFRHGSEDPSEPRSRRAQAQQEKIAAGRKLRDKLRVTFDTRSGEREVSANDDKPTGSNKNRQDGARGRRRGKRKGGGRKGQRPEVDYGAGMDKYGDYVGWGCDRRIDHTPYVRMTFWHPKVRKAFAEFMRMFPEELNPEGKGLTDSELVQRNSRPESPKITWPSAPEKPYPVNAISLRASDIETPSESDDEEVVKHIKGPSNNNVHVTGLMQHPDTKKTTKLRMVIDQGQTVRQGILISTELMQKLNLPYQQILTGKKVGTAKGGASIEKVGITKPFGIKIPGIAKTFKSQAVVCKDLSDQCNLGTAFLQNIAKATGLKPRLEFSADGTHLALGEDQVELVRRIKPTTSKQEEGLGPEATKEVDRGRQARRQTVTEEKRRSASVGARKRNVLPVFVEKDTIVKGNSLNFVQVNRIPASALLEPVKTPGLGGVRAVPGVYRDQRKIAVLNLEEEQVLKAGTQIGEIVPTKHVPQEVPEEKVKSAKESDDRAEELIKELRLDEKKLLNADPALKEKVKALVREYTDVFSSPEVAFGKTSLLEFEVHLEQGSKPVKAKVRPLNPKQKQDLRDQLDRWEAEDVVEECESPWASALVPVLKKGGGIRWAVDYRPLNKMTIKDSYPLPSISENLDKLQGSKVFSTLDAAGAYHCVPVAAKSRPLLAFVTPFGLYTWKRMPFGAANSGPCYSRFMEMLVSKLKSPWTLCYLDDLMVHTVTTEQHLEELKKVFQMHREAGIKLRASKTYLFETEAHYLGYKITQEGVCMREDYVEKILDWPTPTTVKELSSFLGVVGYYRSFIPQFASLTHEMNAQKKKKELEWNEDLQSKFEHLKKLFSEKPIRAYPDYEGECFEVWPDFSALAFGGVLQQVQNGQRRFIAASGRKTTQGERNYPPTKGELASIIHILRKHEHLLRFKKFKVFTDHQPLKWLRTMKSPKGIYWRWIQELESYDFEVIHVAGKKTGAADGLSRSTHLPEPTEEEIAEGEEFVFRIPDQGESHPKLDRVALKEAQEQDEVLRTVKKWVKGDPPKSKEEIRGLPHDAHVYHQHLAVLDVDEGDLLVMTKSPGFNQEGQRILVPNQTKLRDEIFKFSHMHPSAGHFGTQATSARAALKFYWPGMASELKQRVNKCDTCLAKIQQVNLRGGQHKPRKHGFPGEVLYIDLVGPMPETPDGMKYIATMQDGFSRYCTACTIPNKEAVTVANALLDAWITKFGCPVRIHSDQGKEFQNSVWQQLCDRLQIQKTSTPAYNPQSNPIERFHKTLNSIMRTHLAREDAGWSRFLPMATFAYNTKVNASTGVTPFEVWMGRAAKLPIDLVVPTPDRQWPDPDAYIQETLVRFEEMFKFLRKHTEATFKRNARLYAGNANTFKLDDLVWVYSKRKVPNKPNKITNGWCGPFRVVGKPAEVLLDVTPADSEGRTTTVHVARVTQVRGEVLEGQNPPAQQEFVEDDDADELAEDLCLPARWIEPGDNLLVPVKTAPEPPLIRDLPNMRKVQAKAAPALGSAAFGAGPSRAQSTDDALEGNSKKRTLDQSVAPSQLCQFEALNQGRTDEGPDKDKRGRFQGEKRGIERPHKPDSSKQRRRQADKRGRESDSDSSTGAGTRPKIGTGFGSKLGWRDLAGISGSESGVSDQEMQLPARHLQEEELPSSSDEEVKAIREAVHDLGDYVTIDIPPKVKPPERATTGSAGWDCRANQAVTIGPRQTRKVDIGLKMALPAGLCALLLSRSRLAVEGITVASGLIDSDYRGPISCILHNNTECARRIQKGERICQLVIFATPQIKWQTVQQLDDTVRGDGGFGHSGQY